MKHNWFTAMAVIIMKGTNRPQTLSLAPYKEMLPKANAYKVISGKAMSPVEKLPLKARETLILSF